MRRSIFLLFLFFLNVAWGYETPRQRLLSLCLQGNLSGAEKYCLESTKNKLGKGKLDGEKIQTLLDDKELYQLCYMYHFFTSIRSQGITATTSLKDREFSSWLLEHPEIFERLVFSGKIHKTTLDSLFKIWSLEKKELPPPKLNMALGISMIADTEDWNDCLEKYRFFKDLDDNNKLFSQFKTLEAWEMQLLFAGKEALDDLRWGREYLDKHKNITAANAGSKVCDFIPYRDKNKKGISVQKGSEFYDYKPITLSLYVEYGGVCGAVSTGACGFLRSKGIPCHTIGQPGHCAFVWKNEKGKWVIGNNIYGWNWSSGGNLLPWKGPTSQLFSLSQFQTGEHHAESQLCYYLSQLSENAFCTDSLLQQALKYDCNNIPAWEKFLEIHAKKENSLFLISPLKTRLGENAHALKWLISRLISDKEKKRMGYEYCKLLLTEKESRESIDYFMREYWTLATEEIPALKKGINYTNKNRNTFFRQWVEYFQKTKVPQNLRIQICQLMEKTISSLPDQNITAQLFLNAYAQFLKTWNDKKLIAKADAFLNKKLKLTQNPEIRKNLLLFGCELASMLHDDFKNKQYTEQLKKLP